jgi:hypothetical protein
VSMNPFLSLFLVLGAFAVPAVNVTWVSRGDSSAITVHAHGVTEDVTECLDRVKEARLRFEVRLCSRQSAWFDSCEGVRSEMHSVEYEPISEAYRVITDRFGDEDERLAVGVPTIREALHAMTTMENLPLAFLARGEEALITEKGAYVQVRTVFSCRGGTNRTLARLSQVLTLGIVNVVEETSEWHDFELFPSEPQVKKGT